MVSPSTNEGRRLSKSVDCHHEHVRRVLDALRATQSGGEQKEMPFWKEY